MNYGDRVLALVLVVLFVAVALLWSGDVAQRHGYDLGYAQGTTAVVGTLDTAALRRIAAEWDSTGCVWWAPKGGGFVVTRGRP
jgi:hypothetical protein